MQHSDNRRSGFTLVELLVVIAIIVVLIAIALPVFSRARETARQRACMANLYQLAQAVRMYRMDMGFYPGPYDPVTGEGGLNTLYPAYIGSRAVLVCPDDDMDSGAKYVDQVQQVYENENDYREVSYETLLRIAGSLPMYIALEPSGDYFIKLWADAYTDPDDKRYNPYFFSEHYSSYNRLYNYSGYVYPVPGVSYNLLTYAQQFMSVGDNLAYWYMWYRWDPENILGVQSTPQIFTEVDTQLHYHLAMQTYCNKYLAPDDPEDPTASALKDALGRRLWDYGNPVATAYDYMPYGIPGAAFPGLINRNAPENTIITRCSHHRFTASSRETRKDIALRLDGSCVMLVGFSYNWAVQPQQAQ